MAAHSNSIKCPSCGTDINVSDVLFNQVQSELKKNFEAELAKKDKEFQEKERKLQQEREQLLKSQESVQEQIDAGVRTKLSSEKSALEKSLRKKLDDEKADEMKAMQEELLEKSNQLRELNKTKAEVARLQREKGELESEITATLEQKYNQMLTAEQERIAKSEMDKNQLQLAQRDKLIGELKQQLMDTQHKLETGNSKIVGELTEVSLRDYLRQTYPMDVIDDVASGCRGADIIQDVKTMTGAQAGRILYERKEVQNYNKAWVSKLREDGLRVNADVLVLVTSVLPKEKPYTHLSETVWVCKPSDLSIVVLLLRDGILKKANAMSTQENSSTKMSLTYQYLTSQEFANQMLSLLESFRKMDSALLKERDDMLKNMSVRHGHILQAKKAVLGFYGVLSGIAEDNLSLISPQIKMLEQDNAE